MYSIVICIFLLIALDEKDQSTISSALARAVSNRNSISSYHASVNLKQSKNHGESNFIFKFDIWETPQCYRLKLNSNLVKKTESPQISDKPSDATVQYCENCEKEGWYIEQSVLNPSDVNKSVTFSPLSNTLKAGSARFSGIDLRLLGMTRFPYPNLIDTKVKGSSPPLSVFEDPEYSKFQLVSTTQQGALLVKCTSTINGAVVICKIDPSLGYSVTEMTATHHGKNGVVASFEMTSSGIKQYDQNVWFPSLINSKWMADGKTVIEETYSITLHSCNKRLDPTVFSFASMNFVNGTRVRVPGDFSPDQKLIWNGKVVPTSSLANKQLEQFSSPEPAPSLPTPTNPEAVAQPFPWYYALAAVLFAGIAVYFFRRMLNRG
jgi:hypothetical protein